MAKLSKAKRSEIAKKAWRKKKKTGLSASPRSKTSVTRRKTTYRKPSRRRSGLSEVLTNLEAKQGLQNTLNGAGGGLVAYGLERVLPANMDRKRRLLWTVAVGFGIATIGKAPYVGAGVVGVASYKFFDDIKLLNEDYADPLEKLPMVLDADGQPMMLQDDDQTGGLYLDENGNEMYLDEGEELYLDESEYQVAYAPDFGADWAHTWQQQ